MELAVQSITFCTVKPIDRLLEKIALDYKLIFTVEEHNIIGGLGSAVSEVLVQKNKPLQFRSRGYI